MESNIATTADSVLYRRITVKRNRIGIGIDGTIINQNCSITALGDG